MLEGWDPLVVLMIRAFGHLLVLAMAGAVLFQIIKHAVHAGIKLAADDLRRLTDQAGPD